MKNQIYNQESKLDDSQKQIILIIESELDDIRKGINPYTDYADRELMYKYLYELILLCKINTPLTLSRDNEWREHAVRLEQNLANNDPLFISTLKKIKDHIQANPQKYYRRPSCFISYSWPLVMNSHEFWIQSFLEIFVKHLEYAGVHADIDIVYSRWGTSTVAFMNKIKEIDYVMLIGTESLKTKHDLGSGLVCDELNLIKDKYKLWSTLPDTDFNKNFPKIMPILLSGTYETSFPAGYRTHTAIEGFVENGTLDEARKSYVKTFISLLNCLYRNNNLSSFWNELEVSNPNLFTGLTKNSVLEFLVEEKDSYVQKMEQYEAKCKNLLRLDARFSDRHTNIINKNITIVEEKDLAKADSYKKTRINGSLIPEYIICTLESIIVLEKEINLRKKIIEMKNEEVNKLNKNLADENNNYANKDEQHQSLVTKIAQVEDKIAKFKLEQEAEYNLLLGEEKIRINSLIQEKIKDYKLKFQNEKAQDIINMKNLGYRNKHIAAYQEISTEKFENKLLNFKENINNTYDKHLERFIISIKAKQEADKVVKIPPCENELVELNKNKNLFAAEKNIISIKKDKIIKEKNIISDDINFNNRTISNNTDIIQKINNFIRKFNDKSPDLYDCLSYKMNSGLESYENNHLLNQSVSIRIIIREMVLGKTIINNLITSADEKYFILCGLFWYIITELEKNISSFDKKFCEFMLSLKTEIFVGEFQQFPGIANNQACINSYLTQRKMYPQINFDSLNLCQAESEDYCKSFKKLNDTLKLIKNIPELHQAIKLLIKSAKLIIQTENSKFYTRYFEILNGIIKSPNRTEYLNKFVLLSKQLSPKETSMFKYVVNFFKNKKTLEDDFLCAIKKTLSLLNPEMFLKLEKLFIPADEIDEKKIILNS